jgi:nicotinate phosphoribosyltransferase
VLVADQESSFLVSGTGDVVEPEEGAIAFPNEPLLRVHAPLIEAQLIESLALCIVNFQTLVATKAARLRSSATFCPTTDRMGH